VTIGALFLDLTFLSFFIRVPYPSPSLSLHMVAPIDRPAVLRLVALGPHHLDPAWQLGVLPNCIIFFAVIVGTS
jgi:hypothetical protein